MFNKKKFLEVLEDKNILSEDKISELFSLLERNKDFDLEVYLTRNKLLDIEKITKIKAEVYNLPYKNIIGEEISETTLETITEELSANYSAVCFDVSDGKMHIGFIEPNLKAMEALGFLAQGKKLKPVYYLISKKSFDYAFRKYSSMEEEVSSALEIKSKESGDDFLEIKEDEDDAAKGLDVDDANSAPVAKIVSVIIKNAIDSRASDIHIEPYEKESRVRCRIDGILSNALFLPKKIHNSVIARIKVMAKMKLDETRIPQDGRMVLVFDGRDIDFRISTFPVGEGKEKAVMRILDTSKGLITMEDLGFNSLVLEKFQKNIRKTNGIILVTGPTGSGKSTTLYSVLNILNKEGINISTLEDPIEYQLKGVNQSQVRPKIGYTFATGLRSLVRQDPDVIMVGEIRDEETVDLSIHAGLTGHLVLSTLHTNDALGTIFRLMDMDAEPVLLCSILKLIIAQRLVRRLCPHCKAEVEEAERLKFIENSKKVLVGISPERLNKELPGIDSLEGLDNLKIYKAVGCPRCQKTGYMERISIGEVIEMNEGLKDIIMKDVSDLRIDNVKAGQEFVSINQDGLLKVLQGLTTKEEVERVIE
jgi:type IV pilus assembly protein PilB